MSTLTADSRIIPFPERRRAQPVTEGTYDEGQDGAGITASAIELRAKLAAIGGMAPTAPLSFLVVRVMVDQQVASRRALDQAIATIAGVLAPTDVVGPLEPGCAGVVLQGRGSSTASRLGARIAHELRELPALHRSDITVAAASGTGVNARVLPVAASYSFPGCG